MMKKIGILISIIFLSLTASCSSFRDSHNIQFENNPCIIPVKGFIYKTCSPLRVQVDDTTHTVPKGFRTDLASIPRIFWNILPPQQTNFIGPAIFHDWMYTSHVYSRKYADDILYASLRKEGARWDTANIIWLCVRIWGGSHYKES